MLFSLGGNTVDIDIESTKELYNRLPYVWRRCQCPACRNFEERVSAMRAEKLRLFKEIGVDILKCIYLWAYEPGKLPATQKYRLHYPLVCKAVDFDEKRGWEPIDKGLSACFALHEEKLCLMLDWELKWERV